MLWHGRREPLSEQQVGGAEQLRGVRFPEDYRQCVRVNHGAYPDPAGFLVPCEPSPLGSGVGCLLTLDPYAPDNLFALLSYLSTDQQIPHFVVPIATDGGGDFICLDYRSDLTRCNPTVVYWCHELEGEEGFVPMAATFTEFLAKLAAHPLRA